MSNETADIANKKKIIINEKKRMLIEFGKTRPSSQIQTAREKQQDCMLTSNQKIKYSSVLANMCALPPKNEWIQVFW